MEIYTRNGCISNNYMLPAECESLIDTGNLYEAHDNDNVLFFVNMSSGIYRVYYVLNNPMTIDHIDIEWPLMTEILFRSVSSPSVEELKFLERLGFRENLRRDLYAAKAEGNYPEPTFAAHIETAKKAVNLFNASFDRFSGDYISDDEIESLFSDNGLICAYDDNGEFAGALHITIAGKNAWVSHLAVDPGHRRQHIASRLVEMYISESIRRGAKRLQLWVQSQNEAAITLYTRYGFKPSNKSTLSLIKE